MKAKAATTTSIPSRLQFRLDGLRPDLEKAVIRDCFGVDVGSMGSAEFFVQRSDFADGDTHTPFIHYTLSGVTWKKGRKFKKAVEAVLDLLENLVREHWPRTKVQLFVVIFATKKSGRTKTYEKTRLVAA